MPSPQAQARAVIENGQVRAYGVIRACHSGCKIGPLHADDAGLAETLFAALCAAVPPDSPVFLDAPGPNPHALALAARHQLQACFETARMYTRSAPDVDLVRIFGVTSFELGLNPKRNRTWGRDLGLTPNEFRVQYRQGDTEDNQLALGVLAYEAGVCNHAA